MMDRMKRQHPRAVIDKESVPFPICKTNTGWSLDNQKCRETDLKHMGVGVSLYFKFTKYLIIIYLFLSIITIPHIVFYILGGTDTYNNSKTIASFFGMTTLGNLGGATTMCGSGTNFASTVNLFCDYGTIGSIDILGEARSDGTSTCSNDGENLKVDTTCDYSTFTTSEQSSVTTQFDSDCKGKEI
jgi:hypothetical protein